MDALLELEPVLRHKKEGLTPQEAQLMKAMRERARGGFFIGSLAGSLATFLATKRLPKLPRVALSAGAGVVSGIWVLVKSLDYSVQYLLSLQGTRIQGELANLMLKKQQNDPLVQKRVSKYFYPEIVYTDSSADRPLYRWRYRNIFGDIVAPESSQESDSKANDVKTNTKETKQVHASAVSDSRYTIEKETEKENAFDVVFGVPESAGDASQTDAPTSPSRRQTRREKRTRRKRRHAHHSEESEI